MVRLRKASVVAIFAVLLTALAITQAALERLGAAPAQGSASGAPTFQVDPFWPKPLPNNWILGQVPGVAVDSRDHVWIMNRPGSVTADEKFLVTSPPSADCCAPAPPVLEFDAEGNVLRSWGGPGPGYDWPASGHGIFVDHKDNVWVTGSGDHVVLKFTQDGKFLLQIGVAKKTAGSNDTKLLGGPADVAVDPQTNEVYIADGYENYRVIVFDADTGAYKRHWGAYGKRPDDSAIVAGDLGPGPLYLKRDPNRPPPQHFGDTTSHSSVHCVRIANDGLVYVCDRSNNRIQVFQKNGTFVKEVIVAKRTLFAGTAWDLGLSPDAPQKYLYLADGTNMKIWLLSRNDLQILGAFGRPGRSAGQFHWVHTVTADSKGNLYTGEVDTGKRLQKFLNKGVM